MHIATKSRKSVGIELSKTRHQQAVNALDQMKARGLVDAQREIVFIHGNITEEDISDATVIFMCSTVFSDKLLQQLVDRFVTLTPGLRIVTLKRLPDHPQLKLVKTELFPTSWSESSPFNYYELLKP